MILGTDTNENMNSHLLYFSHAMLCNTRLWTGNPASHVWACAAALWSVQALQFSFMLCALDVSMQHVFTKLCGLTDHVFSSKDPYFHFKMFLQMHILLSNTVGYCKCFLLCCVGPSCESDVRLT